MRTIISKLRELASGAGEGASTEDLQALESALEIKLPELLAALYKNHNGAAEPGKLPWRLLSTREALSTNTNLAEEKLLPGEVRLFWADEEGNFAGIYVAGPLHGNVCFFNHEERDSSPRFKTLERFAEAMIIAAEAGVSWREMPVDFQSAEDPRDSDVVKQLLIQFRSATDPRKRRQLAFDILGLTPKERTSDLLTYLDDEDLLVQERAAETLGARQYEPAIPLLVKVAQRETVRVHNARIGAILALGRMKSPNGLQSLFRLVGTIPRTFDSYIVRALELHGCPIKFENGSWNYQLPGSNEWKALQGRS